MFSQRTVIKAIRRGFTLIELLIVMVIYLLPMVVITVFRNGHLEQHLVLQ